MKSIIFLLVILSSTATIKADCSYWHGIADPDIERVVSKVDESNEQNIFAGIECLLKLEGNVGVRDNATGIVSSLGPKATVEINALYQISKLFYGNDSFAFGGALLGEPAEVHDRFSLLPFNAKKDIAKAFESYRKWFEKVRTIGLAKARKQKLDPLEGYGVRWY